MNILEVNFPIGEKCYAIINNAVRECIFLGTRSVDKENKTTTPHYHLNVAGIGEMFIEFDSFHQFNNWYNKTQCYTTLYRTIDDCLDRVNPITAKYGNTENMYNRGFMQKYFPFCSVCNCGGLCYGYIFNGTHAEEVFVGLPKHYIMDKDGFRFLEKPRATQSAEHRSRMFHNCTLKVYKTKNECLAENEPNVVTF